MQRTSERRSGREARGPIELSLLWERLISITDEAAVNLVRTAFSSVVRDANDYICMLLDREGRAVAENSWSIPAFTGALPRTMQHILREIPAPAWRPGDMVITNDPWLGTGHLPDINIVAPIFLDDRLLGFAGSVAHMTDIGGAIFSADTTEVFEEGLRIPIQHLYYRGERNETLVRMIRANVRVPDVVLGDIAAQIAAVGTIERRLMELVREEGLTDLEPVAAALQSRAESTMRDAIRAIPDGVYEASCEIDGIDEPLTIRLAVTVAGSDITFDYAGTSPQQHRGINVPMTNTFAMTAYPLKCLLSPDVPRNDGTYRPVTVRAPAGSLLNPEPPAPVLARHLTFLHLASVVFQALAEVLPDRVIAESGTPFIQVVFAGADQHGEPFVYVPCDAPGMGARATKDGLAATPYPNNTGGAPVEVVEATTPLLFWQRDLVPDSGGAGTYRGGLGMELEVEVLGARPVSVSVLGDRVRHPARGIRGGGAGMPAQVAVNGRPQPAKGRTRLAPGDRVRFRMAGGGGYGPPSERERDAVERDLTLGYVTPEGAKRYE